MEPAEIRLIEITKTFGRSVILQRLSCSLSPGEVTLLLGQNGAGKSTLLKIIAQLITSDSGKRLLPEDPSFTLGYASHEPSLYGQLTVKENLEFFSSLRGVSKTEMNSLMKEWRVDEISDKKPLSLSRGQLAKVGIVRALLGSPTLLILDEPTAFLDNATLEVLITTLSKRMSTQYTIIATHDLERLQGSAQRLLLLKDASTLLDSKLSSASEVLNQYQRSNR